MSDKRGKEKTADDLSSSTVCRRLNGGRSRTRIYDLHDVNGIGFVDHQQFTKQNSVKLRKLRNFMALSVLLYAVVAPCKPLPHVRALHQNIAPFQRKSMSDLIFDFIVLY